jgi:hypothetical protein
MVLAVDGRAERWFLSGVKRGSVSAVVSVVTGRAARFVLTTGIRVHSEVRTLVF